MNLLHPQMQLWMELWLETVLILLFSNTVLIPPGELERERDSPVSRHCIFAISCTDGLSFIVQVTVTCYRSVALICL